ncbi:MAG: hypothetical protein U9R12_06980 [Candidatus Caldatribacteriota bacterium]|nr:hypothetical protein [Candidatus Caldatribacteriota bacterium]
MPEFEDWFLQNINYYAVKHDGDKDEMINDARSAYEEIRQFIAAPPKMQKTKRKKKPNPYGFDL